VALLSFGKNSRQFAIQKMILVNLQPVRDVQKGPQFQIQRLQTLTNNRFNVLCPCQTVLPDEFKSFNEMRPDSVL
jgi:hypothetical protein